MADDHQKQIEGILLRSLRPIPRSRLPMLARQRNAIFVTEEEQRMLAALLDCLLFSAFE
jgi:hypothetical protein